MAGCLLVHGHLDYLSRKQHRLVDFRLLLHYSPLDPQEHVQLSQLDSQEREKAFSNSAP